MPAELVAVAERISNALRASRLGMSGVCRPAPSSTALSREPLNPAAALVDMGIKTASKKAFLRVQLFPELSTAATVEDAARAKSSFLYMGRGRADARRCARGVARLHRPHGPRSSVNRGLRAESAWLDDAGTISPYLHATISTKHHRVRAFQKCRCTSTRCWLTSA